MVLQSELLSHADRVGEGLMLSPPPVIYNVRARKGWDFEKVVRILRLDLEIRRKLLYLCSRKSGGRAMNDRV